MGFVAFGNGSGCSSTLMCGTRHNEQSLPLQGGRAHPGVPGVCCCGGGGVAHWSWGLLLSPHEGSTDHGPPCDGRLSNSLRCNSYLNGDMVLSYVYM